LLALGSLERRESFTNCYLIEEGPTAEATTVKSLALLDLLKWELSFSVGISDFVNVHAIFIIKRAAQAAASLP
jgi:hypothetical protein